MSNLPPGCEPWDIPQTDEDDFDDIGDMADDAMDDYYDSLVYDEKK